MSLADKLDRIVLRGEELQHTLNTASDTLSADAFRRTSQEWAQLQPTIARIGELRAAERARDEAEALLGDPDMRELAEEELRGARERIPSLERELRIAMLPRDVADEGSAILEIRPAAGGDEAALFASELFDAYRRYAVARGWRFELLEYDESELGGLRGGSAEIVGREVFACLKHESGVHRVQRVPKTETQGRIHTSTVTVAILPEAEEVDVRIDEANELRIDVYRASGAGGQHVNKTESAVRITHLPTGLVVAMQEEKSQHKNRAKAMKILRARLYEKQRAEAHSIRSADRRAQVGTGDRSERVRTYNFPQGRVSDHRINLTRYDIDRVMAGEFGEFTDALRQEEIATLLAEAE